jgi:hypothetical protein
MAVDGIYADNGKIHSKGLSTEYRQTAVEHIE